MAKVKKGKKKPQDVVKSPKSSMPRIIDRFINLFESTPLKIVKKDGKDSLSGMMR